MRMLPATGCTFCHQGAKMVLFITGVCMHDCWYCPLSSERKGKDQAYANEHKVSSPEEAVAEAKNMRALGTGITGGEPFARLERVIRYATRLKEAFSQEHHIHLYTSCVPTEKELSALSGIVDEIRMHPPTEYWGEILKSDYILAAKEAALMGFETGFEVPSLPEINLLIPALPYLDFLNINELEWGESNAPEMRRRQLVLEDSVHNAVEGSRGWSRNICRHEKVHFCSSAFKDSVQLRMRLIRIAENTARAFDEISDDGTIIYGRIEHARTIPDAVRQLGPDMYEERDGALETAWWILVESGDEIAGNKTVVERYPNRGIIVEVTPL
jgi:pyruvate formate-lyase activating enzyme-like uncharacterized protein